MTADPLPPWLASQWDGLQRTRGLGRLPHALLIHGPAGVGKRLFAEQLAQSLLCPTPDSDGRPCGRCQDCHLFAVGNHPDLVRVGPDPEAKSGEIKVQSIRDLVESEGLTANRGGYKVILIDPAERMNPSAANALLKTLEEPGTDTLFGLITERAYLLAATVRSRCQRLALDLPGEDQALAWLGERVKGGDPRLLLRLAHGAPLRALILGDPALLARREAAFAGFLAVGQGTRDPVAEALAWSDLNPRISLEWLGGWLSDLLRLHADSAALYLSNPDKREALAPLARRLGSGVGLGAGIAAGHRYLQRVLRARATQDNPLNPQLLHEALLIDWGHLVRKVT
jgi:DNA polymerase-3 subunit delta'